MFSVPMHAFIHPYSPHYSSYYYITQMEQVGMYPECCNHRVVQSSSAAATATPQKKCK